MEWREREHDEHNVATLNHLEIIQTLRNYDQYNFFTIPSIMAQPDLLEWMVRKLNVQEE